MKVLIDGDIIVYSAGSAADYRYYTVDDKEFALKSEARAYVEETLGIKDWDYQGGFIIFHRDPAPVQYSFANCKQLITRIMEDSGADKATMYLTENDDSNYRYHSATLRPYKGNRGADGKPYWYPEIRKYLVERWGAVMVSGREADDAMGCAQYAAEQEAPNSTIIATKDKDLDMIPGWHYNWDRLDTYHISEEQGWRNFYYQLLIGDSTDNIGGCPRVGQKNPTAVGIKEGGIPFDHKDIQQQIYDLYIKAYKGDEVAAWAAMIENADLVWIQREENVLWEPVIEAPECEVERKALTAISRRDVTPSFRMEQG